MGFWDQLFKAHPPIRQVSVRIWDPERLTSGKKDYSRNYKKYKRTFYRYELESKQADLLSKGKKVKCWKMVYCAEEESNDKFVPIYHKRRKRTK